MYSSLDIAIYAKVIEEKYFRLGKTKKVKFWDLVVNDLHITQNDFDPFDVKCEYCLLPVPENMIRFVLKFNILGCAPERIMIMYLNQNKKLEPNLVKSKHQKSFDELVSLLCIKADKPNLVRDFVPFLLSQKK